MSKDLKRANNLLRMTNLRMVECDIDDIKEGDMLTLGYRQNEGFIDEAYVNDVEREEGGNYRVMVRYMDGREDGESVPWGGPLIKLVCEKDEIIYEPLNILEAREKLEKSWDITTTYSPDEWTTSNRAKGQCAVTSLLLQSLFGGEIIKGDVSLPDGGDLVLHYWNRIRGIDVDLTWRQFPERSSILHWEIAVEGELISNDWFMERYNNLLNNFYGKKNT